jgi:hypothetical protein
MSILPNFCSFYFLLRPKGAKGERPARAEERFRAAKTPLAFPYSENFLIVAFLFLVSELLIKIGVL